MNPNRSDIALAKPNYTSLADYKSSIHSRPSKTPEALSGTPKASTSLSMPSRLTRQQYRTKYPQMNE